MGLMDGLKKMGLVSEEVTYPEPTADYGGEYTGAESPPDVDLSSVGGSASEEVITSIYDQGEFVEDSSIYRIQEFINSLPAEMPKQTKYVSIGAILTASRINIFDLIADAEKRITLLGAAHDGLQAEHRKLCDEANSQISDYLAAVEAAKVRMQDSQTYTASTCDIIETEAVQIRELLEFANGVVESTSGG